MCGQIQIKHTQYKPERIRKFPFPPQENRINPHRKLHKKIVSRKIEGQARFPRKRRFSFHIFRASKLSKSVGDRKPGWKDHLLDRSSGKSNGLTFQYLMWV